MDRAKCWARDRGLGKLRVRTNQIREATQRFYERIGFSRIKVQVVFDTDIQGRRPAAQRSAGSHYFAKAKEIARGGQPVLVNVLLGKTDFRKGSISM